MVASDPYRAPETAPDVPVRGGTERESQPDVVHEKPTGAMAALWVPIVIALAFAAGLVYLHYHHPTAATNAHADAGPPSQLRPAL
jgi:hypothetical protein